MVIYMIGFIGENCKSQRRDEENKKPYVEDRA